MPKMSHLEVIGWIKENFWCGFRLDLGGFMSMPSGLSVIVGPISLTLSYCCWQTLIVVMF